MPDLRRCFGVLCAVLLASLALIPNLPAQSNQPPPAAAIASGNRFLFIVETSAAIKPNAPAVLKVVGDLIYSGANGQMHDGDTVGLWTFNQQVYSTLPVQVWAQSIRSQAADRTAAFLRQQPLEKTAQFDKVLTNMFSVISASDFITVIIVSSGDGKMKGTPFDTEMNALYKQAIKDMKGQRLPVVTVLQAKSGKLLRYTINALPWPVIVPEVPLPPKPAPRETPVNPPIATHPAVPAPAPVPAPKPNIPPLIIPRETPAPVVVTQPAAPPVITPPPPAPATAVTTPPPVEIAKNETPIVAVPTPTPPPPVATPKPIIPAAAPTPVPAPVETPRAILPAPVSPPPVTEPVATSKPTPPVIPAPTPATSPPTTPPPAPASPQVSAPEPSAPEPPLAAVAPMPVQRSSTLLIASIVLVIAALVLIFLMVLRNRSNSGPSLITESLGNRKK